MCDRNPSIEHQRSTKTTTRQIVLRGAPRKQLTTAVTAFFLSVVVLAFAIIFAGSPVGADENELPILAEAKGIRDLVLRVSPFCPEPPAHLPAVDYRLEFRESESPTDPITLEILSSKEIRIELTVLRGGLERGESDSYELKPLRGGSPSPHQSGGEAISTSMTIGDLQPGVVHFARALVLVDDGWIPIGTTKFTAPICAVDGLDREEVKP